MAKKSLSVSTQNLRSPDELLAGAYQLDNPGGYVSSASPTEVPQQGSNGNWYIHGIQVPGPNYRLVPDGKGGYAGYTSDDLRAQAAAQEGAARLSGAGGAADGAAGTGYYQNGIGYLAGQLPDPLGRTIDPNFYPNNTGKLFAPAFNTAGFVAPGQVGAATQQAQQAPPVAGAAGVSSTGNSALDALITEAQRNRSDNLNYIDNTLTPALSGIRGGQLGVLANQAGQDQGYAAAMGGLFNKSLSDANAANNLSWQGVQGLGAGLGAINASNDDIYGQMAKTYAGFSQLDPTHQVANLQAAQASLSLANYQTAQLFQAALERAQANPNDVQAQKDALNLAAQISQGSNDVQNGGLTPEAKAAQLSALQQYGALTSPEVTAKERFLYESQRLQQEQQEKASRDALMAEYRMRGQGGSGQELGAILQAGQQNSQQRLLGDLGTQAGAVDRSMQALAGYGGLSTQMVGQGNQVAEFNMSQRLQALGVRADIANQIAANSQQLSEFNAGQANQVNVANAGFANQNAQFNANAYNQNSMFNAGQANQISMFNTGQTNAVNMNNLNQNMAQTRFEDEYRASEQQNAALRAQALAGTGLSKNAANATNLGTLSNAWQGSVNDAFGRNTTATNIGAQAASNIANNGRLTNNSLLGLGNSWAGQDLGVAGLRTGASQTGSTAVQNALGQAAGQQEADKAANLLQWNNQPAGISSFLTALGL